MLASLYWNGTSDLTQLKQPQRSIKSRCIMKVILTVDDRNLTMKFNNVAVCFETVTLLKVNTIYLEGLYFATDSAFKCLNTIKVYTTDQL